MLSENLDSPKGAGVNAFRRFFNPNNLQITNDDLRSQLLENRRNLVPGRLARSIGFKALHPVTNAEHWYSDLDLLATEAAHLDIVPDEESLEKVAVVCGVTVERLQVLKEAAERESGLTADGIVKLTSQILDSDEKQSTYSDLFGVTVTKDTSPVVLAGMLMSVASHEEAYRENGDRPYFSHPLATAQLYQVAWNEVAKDPTVEVPDRKWLHLQLFVNLLHDTVEDQIPKKGSFLEGDTSKVTPLLIRTVLGKLGETDENAHKAANDIMLLTKTRDYLGNKISEGAYTSNYTKTVRAMTAKFCDTAHNRFIDPTGSAKKREKTHPRYDDSLERILYDDMADKHDAFGLLMIEKILEIAEGFSSHEEFVRSLDEKNSIFGRL